MVVFVRMDYKPGLLVQKHYIAVLVDDGELLGGLEKVIVPGPHLEIFLLPEDSEQVPRDEPGIRLAARAV